MPSLPASLARQLTGLSRALRLTRAAVGLALWVAGASMATAALVLLLCFVTPSVQAHQWLTVGLGAVALAALAGALLWPVLTPLRPGSLGRLVERRFPDLQDRLLAAVDPAPSGAALASGELAAALAEEVGSRLRGENLVAAVDLRSLRAAVVAALTGLLTAALIAAACPVGFARLWAPPPAPRPQTVVREGRRGPAPDLTRLGLSDLALQIEPPGYTGLPPERVTEGFEALAVVRGTKVTLSARCTAGSEVFATVGEAAPLLLSGAGGAVSHSFTVLQDIQWALSARLAGKSASVGPFRIRALPDRPPTVKIVEPGRDLILDILRPLHIVVLARDDFGVAQLSLLLRRRGETPWRTMPLGAGGREVSSAFELDLGPMALRPGEAVEYCALARDNDAVSGPKTVVTRVYTAGLKKPPPEPPTPQAVGKAEQKAVDSLDRLQAEAQAFDQQLQRLVQQAQADQARGKAPELSRGALQEAQERLQRCADDVKQAMGEAENSLQANPLVTPDMIRKVQELHRLMSELMNDDLRRVMEKVQEALHNLGRQDLAATLEQAREEQRRFMDKLDRTLSMLRKAKLEAQLEALKRFVEQLADRQGAVQERTARLSEGQRSESDLREQGKLADETSPVPGQVRAISEEMARENEQIASNLRNLAADLEAGNPAREMRRAAGEMERGRPSAARGPQGRAQQSLREAAGRLAGAAADITARDRRALTGAAQRLARNALALSQSQEQLLDETRALGPPSRADMGQQKRRLSQLKRQEEAVERGTEGLAAQMRDLAGQTPLMDPQLAAQAQDLTAEMAQAGRELVAGQGFQAVQRQAESVRGLNELAQRLMRLADKFDQASARMALQEYMKRLEELAQRQQALNQQMGAPQEPGAGARPGGGGQPMPGPGSPGEMALEQALIRQALQKMLGGKGAGNLVDQLGGVPGQMQKSESDMRGGSVTRQTLLRQRDILHKMLDAQRSLYSKQEQGKERKAEAPRPYSPPKAPPLLRPDQARPPHADRQRSDLSSPELPLDFEAVAREYLERIRR